jgi:hypothetical protein
MEALMNLHLPLYPHFSPYAGDRAIVAAAVAIALIILVLAVGKPGL